MALLIDPPQWVAHGRRWSHLVSDTDPAELHALAAAVGIPPRAFEGDHYDIPEERYAQVVAAGAIPTDPRTLLRAVQASGWRLQKRRGDKGVAKIKDHLLPDGTRADIDLIVSSRLGDPARTFGALVFLRDGGGDFAMVYSVRRGQWGPPGGWREPPESVQDTARREVREEVGIALGREDLAPVALERFTPLATHPGGLWRPGQDLLQCFAATVSARRPALSTQEQDTSERRWADPEEFALACGGEFWWPLAQALFTLPDAPARA